MFNMMCYEWLKRKKPKLIFRIQTHNCCHIWQDLFTHIDTLDLPFNTKHTLIGIISSASLILEEKIKLLVTLLMQHHVEVKFIMTDHHGEPQWEISSFSNTATKIFLSDLSTFWT